MSGKPGGPRGLGRGLSALLGEAPPVADPANPKSTGLRHVSIDLLSPNPFQPRRVFVEADLQELTDSIRANGILQPIIVRPDPAGGGRYQIVAGERRWRSAQRAGLHEAPVVVREFTDDQSAEVAIIENVQRAGLNAIEEALGYQALVERFSYTQDKLAENVGKSRSHIANTLRLLVLPEDVRAMVEEGKLSAGHARALITADNPIALAREAVARGLSVREMEALARAAQTNPQKGGRKASAPKDIDTMRLEKDIAAALGCKVSIDPDGGERESGKIVIHYKDVDQFDDILHRLQ